MQKISEILVALEEVAPRRFAFGFDKVGLQVGDPRARVSRAVVALDRSLAAIEYAIDLGAHLLLTHHPLIFQPISTVTAGSHVGDTILRLIRHEIHHIAAHTNWDSAAGGVNDALASLLSLTNVRSFGEAASVPMLKLVYGVPTAQSDATLDACAAAGAGIIGAYRRCAFGVTGVGTFEPQEGARPAIGTVGGREHVEESRIEINVPPHRLDAVLTALRRSHPYEEPAIDVYTLRDVPEQPIGRLGDLPQKTTLQAFASLVDERLGTRCSTWGQPDRVLNRAAVVGGAADGEWRAARNAGADVLVTGEVKQHVALEAAESGMAILAAGHYATENPGALALKVRMAARVPEVEWHFFEPAPGVAGRPF